MGLFTSQTKNGGVQNGRITIRSSGNTEMVYCGLYCVLGYITYCCFYSIFTGSSAVSVKLEAPKSPTSYGSFPVSPKSPWSGGSGSVSPNYDAPKYKPVEVVEEVSFDASKYKPVEIHEEVVVPSSHLQVEAERPRLHSVEDEFDEASSRSVHDKLKMFEDGKNSLFFDRLFFH